MGPYEKSDVKNLLDRLGQHLNRTLPPREALIAGIDSKVREAATTGLYRQYRYSETAFVNGYIVEQMHAFLSHELRGDASTAILSESAKHQKGWASESPSRRIRHPFSKSMGRSAAQVMEQWRSKNALVQACPDLALRDPAPRVVIEAKYFRKGSKPAAERALVEGIYQAFFYRALPPIHEPAGSKRPSWNYEYACLLICDASDDGAIESAWKCVSRSVKHGCWEGGNVYVMVLRPGPSGGAAATAP